MGRRSETPAPAGTIGKERRLASEPGTAAVVLIGSYIAAQIMSDIGSLKITTILGLAMDAGTFIYPITFTLRDLVHKRLGRRAAREAVLLAGALNVFMALYLQLVAQTAPDPTWPLNEAFVAVLGPVWRIVVASIIAEVVGELLDGEIYHLWTVRFPGAPQWTRVLVSNAVSVPLDSLVFCWGAFAFTMPSATVWAIVGSNILMKAAVTLLSLPGIYLVKQGDAAQ